MVLLRLSREFIFRLKTANFFLYMLVYFALVLCCSFRFFFCECSLSFALILFVFHLPIYFKVHQQNSSDRIPGFPFLHTLSWEYRMIRNWSTARTLLIEILNGGCVCFSKEGMFSFPLLNKQFVFVYDPNIVESILSSKTNLQKGFPYGLMKPLLKGGLVTSEGSTWHYRRKLITPAFNFKILEGFIPVYNKHAEAFVKSIDDLMQKQASVNIMPLARRCTLDIILETSVGKIWNSLLPEGDEYSKALEKCSEIFSIRILLPWLWPDFIFNKTKIGKTFRKCLDVMERFTMELINDRLRERSESEKDNSHSDSDSSTNDRCHKTRQQRPLLDLLLDIHLKDSNNFSFKDIAEEVDTFVSAGHDTVATALSWTLYLLGLHQDIQREVQEEVDSVLGDDVDRKITVEDIKKLKYLHCVLKESMRLYPPVPMVSRSINEDIIINGYKIVKGTNLVIPIYMVHRNPEIYPNPEEFNPERFRLRNLFGRHPFSYVPFSGGARNCIGQRFAINELITILATVLRNFDIISLEHRDKIKFVLDAVLTAENGSQLVFTRRNVFRNYAN